MENQNPLRDLKQDLKEEKAQQIVEAAAAIEADRIASVSKPIEPTQSMTAVFGIYPDRLSAESAVDHLKLGGFESSDISVLLPDSASTQDFAHEKHTKAPEGTAAGVGAGALLGGAFGWLAGVGALAIPGIGPLIAAGPIVAALAGASVGGAIGGLTGALIGMGIPEFEAKRYEGQVKNGGILLSVRSQYASRIQDAKDLLVATGAHDISSSAVTTPPPVESGTIEGQGPISPSSPMAWPYSMDAGVGTFEKRDLVGDKNPLRNEI